MRRQGEFWPVITLLADDDFDRRMRRIIEFHTARGWRVKRARVAQKALMPGELRSCADIELGECSRDPPRDRVPIDLLLAPPRSLVRRGARERQARLDLSSLPCSLSEHAVELYLTKECATKSVSSLRELVEGLRPPFAALGSSLFRGPSLAELREATNPFRVELERIYMSREVLRDEVEHLFDDLETAAWEEGLLVSGDPAEVTRRCWPILRRWAYSLPRDTSSWRSIPADSRLRRSSAHAWRQRATSMLDRCTPVPPCHRPRRAHVRPWRPQSRLDDRHAARDRTSAILRPRPCDTSRYKSIR